MESVEEATFFLSEKNVMKENYLFLKRFGLFIKNPLIVLSLTILQEAVILLAVRHLFEADISKGHPNDFLTDIIMLTSSLGLIYCKFSFCLDYKRALVLAKKLSDFSVFGKPPNFKSRQRTINRLYNFYTVGCLIAIVFMIITVSLDKSCAKQREIDKLEKICGTLMPAYWGGKNLEEPPFYQLVLIGQIITVIFVPMSSIVVHGILFASIEHVIVKIDHLKLMFKEINGAQDDFLIRKQINKCTKYHIFIISMVDDIKQIFSGLLLSSVTYQPLVIGMNIAQLLMEADPQEVTHLGAWILTYYLICLSGQRIYDNSISLQETIGELDWYNLKKDFAKDLQLIILRSQRPLTLQAGKLAIIVLPTFVNVAKTAYSFVAIVKQSMNH